MLTLPIPIPNEENKLSQILFSHFFYGASKGFMKALRFEAPHRRVKIKI